MVHSMIQNLTSVASCKFAPGKHILLDLYEAEHLTDLNFIEQALNKAASICGANVLKSELHSFGENSGVTGVALLAESHISIHTWPELNYAAIDIFMCGACEPELAIEPLKQFFSASDISVHTVLRGQQMLSSQKQQSA